MKVIEIETETEIGIETGKETGIGKGNARGAKIGLERGLTGIEAADLSQKETASTADIEITNQETTIVSASPLSAKRVTKATRRIAPVPAANLNTKNL